MSLFVRQATTQSPQMGGYLQVNSPKTSNRRKLCLSHRTSTNQSAVAEPHWARIKSDSAWIVLSWNRKPNECALVPKSEQRHLRNILLSLAFHISRPSLFRMTTGGAQLAEKQRKEEFTLTKEH